MIALETVIGAVVELGVQKPIEASIHKTKRSESIVRILKKLGLEGEPTPDDFESIYVYSLIDYGVFKPEPILNFFKNEFIRKAFKESFYKNDPSILEKEAEGIIDWNEETKKLGNIDYDPRIEIAAFTAVFNEFVNYSRTPAQAKHDKNISEVRSKVDDILNQIGYLATLDEIRQILHELQKNQPDTRKETRYSWEVLKTAFSKQVKRALDAFSNKYSQEIYVKRLAEERFFEFTDSDKIALVIVDQSGRGKTNLLCSLATQLFEQNKPNILLRGDATLTTDNGFEQLLCVELGFDANDFQTHLEQVSKWLKTNNQTCIVFLDGVSENENPYLANKALRNLILRFAELREFKICLTCRDVMWSKINYDLPGQYIFPLREPHDDLDKDYYVLQLGDFRDNELDKALPLYKLKYSVSFDLTVTAQNQLKHPLLLRLFCEANRGTNLGLINGVPIGRTFNHYLNTKADIVSNRLNREYRRDSIVKFLLDLVGQMWQQNDTKTLSSSEWEGAFHKKSRYEENRKLINFLEEEGVIRINVHPITHESLLKFVFDELQEFLLLKFLLAETLGSSEVMDDVIALARKTISSYEATSKNKKIFRLISLIGMELPDLEQRQVFLAELLEWDFQTFCACLINLPPTGMISRCDNDFITAFARSLCNWYEKLISSHFENMRLKIDPWCFNNQPGNLGIRLRADAECREVSYEYKFVEAAQDSIQANLINEYPTWNFQMKYQEDTWIKIHDPESGTAINDFRRNGPGGSCIRILNFKFPWFSGVSLNSPERMALYNFWIELSNLINKGVLPSETLDLVSERARKIVLTVDQLEIGQGLTLEHLQAQSKEILTQFQEGSPEYDEIYTNLNNLGRLLSMLNKPFQLHETPFPEFYIPMNGQPKTYFDLTDQEILNHLTQVIARSLYSYKSIAEKNFQGIKDVLNTYVNIPCDFVVLTDRKSVKLILVPSGDEKEITYNAAIVENVNPNSRIRITYLSNHVFYKATEANSEPIENYIQKVLASLNMDRPPIHPIDELLPIDKFFGATPINDMVKRWLLSDLAKVFGF